MGEEDVFPLLNVTLCIFTFRVRRGDSPTSVDLLSGSVSNLLKSGVY